MITSVLMLSPNLMHLPLIIWKNSPVSGSGGLEEPVSWNHPPDCLPFGQSEHPRSHRRELDPHASVIGENRDLSRVAAPWRSAQEMVAQLVNVLVSLQPSGHGPENVELLVVVDLLLREDRQHVGRVEGGVAQLGAGRGPVGIGDAEDVGAGLEPYPVEARIHRRGSAGDDLASLDRRPGVLDRHHPLAGLFTPMSGEGLAMRRGRTVDPDLFHSRPDEQQTLQMGLGLPTGSEEAGYLRLRPRELADGEGRRRPDSVFLDHAVMNRRDGGQLLHREQRDQAAELASRSSGEQAAALHPTREGLHAGDVRSDPGRPNSTREVPAFLRLEPEAKPGEAFILDGEVGVVPRAVRAEPTRKLLVGGLQRLHALRRSDHLLHVLIGKYPHGLDSHWTATVGRSRVSRSAPRSVIWKVSAATARSTASRNWPTLTPLANVDSAAW